ncbi:class I SAM-dependent methyltransferase [Glaciecola sp. 1036]|uniref:class I SAM-dependent methyltransferase n=1 Tax=Alteromonadaceae TaxID=72275 RepID=UPI003CFC42A8
MRKSVLLLLASLLVAPTYSAFADPISDAVADESRSSDARLRDEYRHPQQTLRFFDVQPEMTVVEISPGGGWYSNILAPLLEDKGKLVAAHFYLYDGAPGYYKRLLDAFKTKMTDDGIYSKVELTAFHPTKALDIAEPSSADRVLTFRNVHNWYMGDGDKGVLNAMQAFYKALKPGGILGVVEHRLPESATEEQMNAGGAGYMKQSYVIEMAEKAGFELVATSEINANPMDTADHPKGVWTLPPSMAMGDEKRNHYLSIGESDRMTLKFVKPE